MNKTYSTDWKFKLGEKVKDIITGWKGTVTARIEYLNGCLQYCVESKVDKEGKIKKAPYIDEGQLELQKSRKVSSEGAYAPGGDMPNAPDKIGD